MNDSKKLKMILDHHREYYINPREYLFFEEGFLSYELYTHKGYNSIHFHEFYVAKEHRGKSEWRNIFKEAMHLRDKHNLSFATCCLQKEDNIFLDKLKHIYTSWGFYVVGETDSEIRYTKDLR